MTTQPIPTYHEPESADARALTLPLVIAQAVQNILGGVGAGVAVAGLMWLGGAAVRAWLGANAPQEPAA